MSNCRLMLRLTQVTCKRRFCACRTSLPETHTTEFMHVMREHEEFEVETDRAGESPSLISSETVRRVVMT